MGQNKKFAVILSGCGVYDGAEIHEATMTLYAIVKRGSSYQCYAPDVEQAHVVNHLTGEPTSESRNVLVEAARIARGEIEPLSNLDVAEYDAIIFPGGFGVAKNLSNFAFAGDACTVHGEVEKAVQTAVAQKKSIGALCIAPAIIAKVLGNVNVTIGQDKPTAQAIEAMGATHQKTTHGEVVVDEGFKLYTTPCYMLDASIVDIAEGAHNIVKAMLDDM